LRKLRKINLKRSKVSCSVGIGWHIVLYTSRGRNSATHRSACHNYMMQLSTVISS
jgi:hypothetical protein